MKTITILFSLFVLFSCKTNAYNLILFSYENKYGYVDENFNIVITPKFKTAEKYSSLGYAVVSYQNRKYAVIDKNGNVLFEADTSLIYHMGEDLYSYSLSDMKNAIIRLRDKKVIADNLASRGYAGIDKYILVSFLDEESQYSFIDFEGNRILPKLFMKKYSYPFYEERAIITKDNWEWSIIDLQGNEIAGLDFYRLVYCPIQTTE